MRCLLLGSGGSVNTPARHNVSLYFDKGNTGVMIDCNGVAVQRLTVAGINFEKIKHIMLTHEHIDHINALNNILHQIWLNTCWYVEKEQKPRKEPIFIYGNAPTLSAVEKLMSAVSMREHPKIFPIELVELDETGAQNIGGTGLSCFPVKHGGAKAFGVEMRSDNGRGIIYSSDTEPVDGVFDRAESADILVHECNKIDREISSGHSTWSQISLRLKKRMPGKVVLVHLPAMSAAEESGFADQVRKDFGEKVILGTDGLMLTP